MVFGQVKYSDVHKVSERRSTINIGPSNESILGIVTRVVDCYIFHTNLLSESFSKYTAAR